MHRAILLAILIAAVGGLAAVEIAGGHLAGRAVLIVRAPAQDPLPAVARQQLRQRVTIAWEDLSVAEACDQLARTCPVPVVVAPELRVTSEHRVSLHLADVQLATVFDWIARQGRVQITPRHGGLYVSTGQATDQLRTSYHLVGDLVMPLRDFPGPELAYAAGDDVPSFDWRPAASEPQGRFTADELAELCEKILNPR